MKAASRVGTKVQAVATYRTVHASCGNARCSVCQSPKRSTTRLAQTAIVSNSIPNRGRGAISFPDLSASCTEWADSVESERNS